MKTAADHVSMPMVCGDLHGEVVRVVCVYVHVFVQTEATMWWPTVTSPTYPAVQGR